MMLELVMDMEVDKVAGCFKHPVEFQDLAIPLACLFIPGVSAVLLWCGFLQVTLPMECELVLVIFMWCCYPLSV